MRRAFLVALFCAGCLLKDNPEFDGASEATGSTTGASAAVGSDSDDGYTSVYEVVHNGSFAELSVQMVRRVGEIVSGGSTLLGAPIRRVDVLLQVAGAPTGAVNVVVRRGTDDSVALALGTIEAQSLSAETQRYSFEATTSYELAANDKILVEWEGTPSSADQVLVLRNVAQSGDSSFGGAELFQVHMYHGETEYKTWLEADIAGQWWCAH